MDITDSTVQKPKMDRAHANPPSDQSDVGKAAMLMDKMLRCTVELDASDLHLAAGEMPYFRIHGALGPQANQFARRMDLSTLQQMAQVLLDESGLAAIPASGDLDGAISCSNQARFRFNLFRRQGNLSIAFRRLEESFYTLEELGLRGDLYELCKLKDGLVILGGPTGSGKSTTIATLIHEINRQRADHIITIEDPVEYLHQPIQSLINQRQIGRDASSFNDALVASLRQDPDVILVGEIREENTIRTAITAAETGHLVFTTVHAGDCVGVIERLVSVFSAQEQDGIRRQLALVLKAIVAQHLLVVDTSRLENTRSGILSRRRVLASEVLKNSSAVANLIATAKSSQIYSSMQTGATHGMYTLEQDLARLMVEGWVSEEKACVMCRQPEIMMDHARRLRQGGGLSSAVQGRGSRKPRGGAR